MAFGRMGLMGRGFGHEGGSPGSQQPPSGQQFLSVTDNNGTEQFVTVTDSNGVEQRVTVATGLS
jgi:hypothetical protein